MKSFANLAFVTVILILLWGCPQMLYVPEIDANQSEVNKISEEKKDFTDITTSGKFEFNSSDSSIKEAYILLKKVDDPNRAIGTAFSLYVENFICLNTEDHPTKTKGGNFVHIGKHKKVIYCDKYYFIEKYSDASGPRLFGPFYEGNLSLKECKSDKAIDACYFVIATKTGNYQICDNINDSLWKEKCIEAIAFDTENVSLCKTLPTLKVTCYQDLIKGKKISKEICSQMDAERDWCLKSLSRKEGDVVYCANITAEIDKDQCYSVPIVSVEARNLYINLEKNEANCDNQRVFGGENKKICEEFMKSIGK